MAAAMTQGPDISGQNCYWRQFRILPTYCEQLGLICLVLHDQSLGLLLALSQLDTKCTLGRGEGEGLLMST